MAMAAGDPNFAGGAATTPPEVNLSIPGDAYAMLQLAYDHRGDGGQPGRSRSRSGTRH